MSTAKEMVREIVETQPDDASYEEILKELTFDQMIARGMKDVRANRVADDKELARRIKLWRS